MPEFVVLGANGQLGSAVVAQLPPDTVAALTHADLDITDVSRVAVTLRSLRPRVVFNCAAFVRVDDAEDAPEEAWRVNAAAALYLARLCADLDATLVHISTDYVFDGRKGAPYTELDVPCPLSVYGATKLLGEFFVRAYCPRHIVVRTAGLYGLRGSRAKGGNFIERILAQARAGTPLRVVADQVTSPTYARDLAAHLVRLAAAEKFGLYHIANSGHCSWHTFAVAVLELAGLEVVVEPIDTATLGQKARRPAFSALVSVRLLSAGLPPLRHWREALAAYWVDRQAFSVSVC
ncbi:dTDP-4-dehydrorhamnose reductase [bacterium HR17]|uniref:dTDP-4-dehydrorhamnose reductase n=1 Tax=Candidatus Fervidibacter japonicus TaxID=2035412 RepID=A0A2H5XCC2_9BACT|nr:dTDP-4-dehydrorhamnose reductase [bacterium HR17]